MNSDRREAILNYIKERGHASLKELKEIWSGLSEMTLRRDMAYLEEKGHIIRTRGGAIAANVTSMVSEDVYARRASLNIIEKQTIAHKALTLVRERCSIFLDSGSTMMCFARALPDAGYYIVTADPNIALECIHRQHTSVTLIGGNLSRNTLSASGATSMEFLKSLNIDMAFMSCSGYAHETGFTSGTYSECELKRAVLDKASSKIMLMDSSKADKRMPFSFARLNELNYLIMDNMPSSLAKEAEECGVKVL